MNKYGYDKYIEKYIQVNKLGISNRGTLSSEWIYALELPVAILVYHFRMSVFLIMGSLAILVLISVLFNVAYNKMMTTKLLELFRSDNKEKSELMSILDQYIVKHQKSNRRIQNEKALYLEKAKSCVNEPRDHLL